MSINPNPSKYFELKNLSSAQEDVNAQVFTKYYDSGELLLRGRSIDNQLNGRGQVFYRNGNIHCDLMYKDNQMHGICKGYYLNGVLALEVLFDMGRAVYGYYYKKSGKKTLMTQTQLERKSDDGL